jgi:Tfp pilus assembly protein PilF
MGRSPKITGLLAWIVTLLAIGLVVAPNATAQETLPRDAQAYINRGLTYLNKGDYDRAIADFNEAIQIDPNNALAYANRGVIYHNKGDYDRAIADYTQAIQLDPKNAMAYYGRGDAFLNKGDNERAIANLNQAIQLDPKNARAYMSRGAAFLNKGDNERAIADYTKAAQLDPKLAQEKGVDQWLAQLQNRQAQVPASSPPQPSFPAFTGGLVVDTANLLTPEQRARLEAKLKADERYAEVVVATVPSLGGLSSQDYAEKLFRYWRLKDVLVLVSAKERQVYIRWSHDFCGQLKMLPGALSRL